MIGARVIVALDLADECRLMALVEQLAPSTCNLKIGNEVFTRFGPSMVKSLVQRGFRVFLDLKFHDIPNTVAHACAAAADLGVWMVNLHAAGGERMMTKAREALAGRSSPPILLAVTVLTSMDHADLAAVGIASDPVKHTLRLGALARRNGLDGVVCAPTEVALLRQHNPAPFLLVTPGIRMINEEKHDQKRVRSAAEAISLGSDYVVIGRSITMAENPAQALATINQSLPNVS